MQTTNDCGATIPPNLDRRANSWFQWIGFGLSIAWTQRRMSVAEHASHSWPPPTRFPTRQSTSERSSLGVASPESDMGLLRPAIVHDRGGRALPVGKARPGDPRG